MLCLNTLLPLVYDNFNKTPAKANSQGASSGSRDAFSPHVMSDKFKSSSVIQSKYPEFAGVNAVTKSGAVIFLSEFQISLEDDMSKW